MAIIQPATIVRALLLNGCIAFLSGCTAKDPDHADAKKSFLLAKEPFDHGNYEIAITELGKFKSQFPYSSLATEAELLLANSHFGLGRYSEASAAYEQFIKLHPKHPTLDFAQYRIGQCYWQDAPKEVDREQEYTLKAMEEWSILLEKYPDSRYRNEVLKLTELGRRRNLLSEKFIADFYHRQKIWHASAYRHVHLAEKAPVSEKELIKESLLKAAEAMEKMGALRTEQNKDKNLYYKKMNTQELNRQAEAMRKKAAKL